MYIYIYVCVYIYIYFFARTETNIQYKPDFSCKSDLGNARVIIEPAGGVRVPGLLMGRL